MLLKHLLMICLLFPAFFSCSQKPKISDCEKEIDKLYADYKEHFIFYCYYAEEVAAHSGADTIYEYLPFYRDQLAATTLQQKDSKILASIKGYLCKVNTPEFENIRNWCNASSALKKVRERTTFTLDGYMSFLASAINTKMLVEKYLSGDRTIDSLSTDEMEYIYFSSITLIVSLSTNEQKLFYDRLAKWDFTK